MLRRCMRPHLCRLLLLLLLLVIVPLLVVQMLLLLLHARRLMGWLCVHLSLLLPCAEQCCNPLALLCARVTC